MADELSSARSSPLDRDAYIVFDYRGELGPDIVGERIRAIGEQLRANPRYGEHVKVSYIPGGPEKALESLQTEISAMETDYQRWRSERLQREETPPESDADTDGQQLYHKLQEKYALREHMKTAVEHGMTHVVKIETTHPEEGTDYAATHEVQHHLYAKEDSFIGEWKHGFVIGYHGPEEGYKLYELKHNKENADSSEETTA